MKTGILSIFFLSLLFACTGGNKQEAERNERDSLLGVINQREVELDEIMELITEVQEGFKLVREAEGRVELERSNIEKPNVAQLIREDMDFIRETMELNRKSITELNGKLKRSSINGDKLKKTVTHLQEELERRQTQIEQLQNLLSEKEGVIEEQGRKIENLNTNVRELNKVNEAKTKVVEKQDTQLHSAWFVFGTKSELTEQKILEKGEVLRSTAFNKDYFTQVDIRTFSNEIKLYSKSAKLLTDHPVGSYSLSKDSKGQYVLTINNSEDFWRVSKFLVILVK